jgi:ATP-binding cassette, subfamily B, bacterial
MIVSMKIPLRKYRLLLATYFSPYWKLTLSLGIFLFGGVALRLVNPQILKNFIDLAVSGGSLNDLLSQGVWFLGSAILLQVLAVLETYLATNLGLLATNHLRADLTLHLLNLDMSYHKQHTPGEMIERIDGDVGTLGNFFSRFVIEILGSLVLMAGILIAMYLIDWRVGLTFTLFCTLTLTLMALLKDVAVPLYRKARQSNADLFGFLEERISGTEDVRANGAVGYVLRRFFEHSQPVWRNWVTAFAVGEVAFGSAWILFAIGSAVSLALGAYLYQHAWITIGTVYLIFRYAELLQQPLQNLIRQFADLQQAGASAVRILDLLNLHSSIPNIGQTTLPSGAALSVQFNQVSFAYQDTATASSSIQDGTQVAVSDPQAAGSSTPVVAENVLNDIDFELPPGIKLGLLGRTGSGKTTLTRLLVRFYEPQQGQISLGKVPIEAVPLALLRKHIGLVTQDIQLFNASLRDNLTLFDPSIPDNRILLAFEQLGLTDWFNTLPEGLATRLEPGGSRLSAGEAQLLAFVRVFLHDPGLVILDEASSRLDPATEARLDRAIQELLHERTAIIIAHRLGTVQRADRILILENGRQIEYGERQQLAQNPDSYFARLLQTGLQEALA